MLDVGLEVEVEAIKADIAEGSKSLRSLLLRAKGLPDELGSVFGIGIGFKAALAVGCTSNREKDSLAFVLAFLDVLSTPS